MAALYRLQKVVKKDLHLIGYMPATGDTWLPLGKPWADYVLLTEDKANAMVQLLSAADGGKEHHYFKERAHPDEKPLAGSSEPIT